MICTFSISQANGLRKTPVNRQQKTEAHPGRNQ
jgi:hypothetical protein